VGRVGGGRPQLRGRHIQGDRYRLKQKRKAGLMPKAK